MGLQIMEVPTSTLTPLAPPGVKGEGQGKRERGDDKCGHQPASALGVLNCPGIFVIFPGLSWEPVSQFLYL